MSLTQLVSEASESCGFVGYAKFVDGQWHAAVRFSGVAVDGQAEPLGSALRTAIRRAAELNREGN